MSKLKDLERTLRLCEKEVDTLADPLAQREAGLRIEVDRLRLGLEAVKRYLGDKDPPFFDTYRSGKRQILREIEGEEEE